MEARTEGWIAGLQLAALSMQGSKDIHGFVSAFTGSHHYVMDYLVEEVLKIQPKKVSTFLLQTSILERLCGPLCEAVVEADATAPVDGQAMLESLEEMNLFTIPLDDERHWYRYHHLFADVLRKRLEHQYPQLLPELHRRASQWYEQNGFIAESIQHAIAAGDQDRAAQLIEENGCFLLMSGEVATLLNWTDAIDFQSETRPWLAIQKAWALALTGDLDRVEPTLQVPEKLLAPLEPTDEVRTMQGTIAAARAQCANSRGDTQFGGGICPPSVWSCCPTAVPSLKASAAWQPRSSGMPAGSMGIWRKPTMPTPKPSASAGRRITSTWSSSPTQILPKY